MNISLNIFSACRNGDVETVKLLVASRVDVNFSKFSSFRGDLPLFIAIKKGFVEIVKILVAAKANPETSVTSAVYSKSNKSMLRTAIESGRADIVKILLDARASANG